MSDTPLPPPNANPPVELQKTVQGLLNADQMKPPPKPADDQGIIAWMVEKSVDVVILVVALLNLTLVFFDYSYVMLRPYYLKYAPQVVRMYDPMKGIDPHDETKKYLEAADQALALAQQNPSSPDALAAMKVVQQMGADIIKDDPFTISNQRGVLEQIKHQAERHMAERAREDAGIRSLVGESDPDKAATIFLRAKGHSILAMQTFWTPENLSAANYASESKWYRAHLAPLMERAFYPHFGEDGRRVDLFWQIDLAFAAIFLLEFLLRAIWVLGIQGGGGKPMGVRTKEFLASRWMDIAYFVPLVLYVPVLNSLLPSFIRESIQLVRMFSVGFRMSRLGLINPVEVVQAKVADVMDMITDQVNVKLLSNYQQSIQEMDLALALKTLTPQQREQLTVLIQRNLTMVLRDVLPDITPQLERLINYAAQQALEQAPAYKQLKRLPFFGALPDRMVPNLVTEVMAGTQVTMLRAINDAENIKLTNEMIDAATDSLIKHMAEVGTEAEVKRLLYDLLEEQKRKVLAD